MSNWTEEELTAHLARIKGGAHSLDMAGTPTLPPAPDVRESVIEASCTEILQQDGWRALRTDPVSDRGRGKGFGELGMADHLYIRYTIAPPSIRRMPEWAFIRENADVIVQAAVMWIEFKRPGETAQKH